MTSEDVPVTHCWADGPEIWGYCGECGSRTWTSTTCMLLAGHLGRHVWTSDKEITVSFEEGRPVSLGQPRSFEEGSPEMDEGNNGG